MLESFEPRGDWVVVRNPAWWGTAEYPHNIDRVIVHRKEADAGNVAALLEGEIDLLQGPPYSAIDQIRRHNRAKARAQAQVGQCSSASISSAELRSSNVKGKNPFKD